MKRFLPFIFFLAVMSSCDEENLSLPTPVELTFIAEPLQTLNNNLIVDGVEINISRLEIDGTRDAGGNVLLERQFNQEDGYIDLRSQINNKILIDIPQGIYNSLKFRLNFQRDEEEREEITEELTEWLEEEYEEDDEERNEDLGDIIEEYLEDVNPAFLFTATANRNGTTFKIIMPLNESVIFDIPFINNDGERNISLIKDQRQEFELVFNPDYWFSITSFDALNNAQKGIIEEEEYVFLHKQVNPALYSLIIGRIEESTVVKTK
ncbi:hypothetical protein ABWH96_18535 [Marivirga tractuosa]|uniref:hypothetical protein n=1 Tax=Marivirga tractuosa TaxID=1006 RepID=UPI0035D08AB3